MIVLLDCDGVLCNLVGGLCDVVNDRLGLNLKPADCTQWDIATSYNLPTKLIDDIFAEPGFCASLQPFSEAIEAVHRMRERHTVFCVTAPFAASPYWMHERASWLERYFDFDRYHMIHASAKWPIRGDILVDDKPETIRLWAQAWPESTAILLDRSYNQGAALFPNAMRVKGWHEVLCAVEGR